MKLYFDSVSNNEAQALNSYILYRWIRVGMYDFRNFVDLSHLNPDQAFKNLLDRYNALKIVFGGGDRGLLTLSHALFIDADDHMFFVDFSLGEAASVNKDRTTLKWFKSGSLQRRDDKYQYITLKLSDEYLKDKRMVIPRHKFIAMLAHPEDFYNIMFDCEGHPVVNHKNNVSYDNRPSNLEWVSQKQNNIHAKYLRTLVKLDKAYFTNPDKLYLVEGVSALALHYALILYKTLNRDTALFFKHMNNLTTIHKHDLLEAIDEYDPSDPTDLSNLESVVAYRFLKNPNYVKTSDIDEGFAVVFLSCNHLEIVLD